MGNVDSFQGQERDISAITLTRSNPQGEIGFLSGIRRMNVGMARARRKLLLVGEPEAVHHRDMWLLWSCLPQAKQDLRSGHAKVGGQ